MSQKYTTYHMLNTCKGITQIRRYFILFYFILFYFILSWQGWAVWSWVSFWTAYQNLSILTILTSLSNIFDKTTVQQSENSENSDSVIIQQSDHSNNSDELIWHFWPINCLTIQHFQQFWLVYPTVSMQILTIPMSLSDNLGFITIKQ